MNPMPATGLAVAKNLRALMDDRGLSQAELARKTSIGQSTLSNLLDQSKPLEINPRLSTLSTLADYFGVPVWMLAMDGMTLDLLKDSRLVELIQAFRDSSPEGQSNLTRIALAEARLSSRSSSAPSRAVGT